MAFNSLEEILIFLSLFMLWELDT